MFTATRLQAATYLLGVCLFSISFLVFLNSTVSFVVTEIIKQRKGVGNAVGTLGFADELVALIACPVWGVLSDRIGVRTVCVLGYAIVGLALFLFVQARNVFPQLLLARLFFSIGGAATATMVTAILPSMTATSSLSVDSEQNHDVNDVPTRGESMSPSLSSELTITPARLEREVSRKSPKQNDSTVDASPTRLAGLVGIFTGCGALVALGLFLPLPSRFQEMKISADQALADTYYVVGAVALFVAFCCFLGLRNLKGEEEKNWRMIWWRTRSDNVLLDEKIDSNYGTLLLESIRLGFSNRLIGLAYIGGFVARASSVGISLFIPLFVNAYFISSGTCKIDDPTDVKSQCKEAYKIAAILTGTSQLVALMFAPIFGYFADRYKRFHIPLLLGAVSGVAGYVSFASLSSPMPGGKSGSPVIFLVVALIGISQIGSIVCSLGLLGRGILGLEVQLDNKGSSGNHAASGDMVNSEYEPAEGRTTIAHARGGYERGSLDEMPDAENQTTSLLSGQKPRDRSLNHLKGSIAGVYSLTGGAAILLLTKLGGFLFDTKSPASPFYMLAVFNAILLVAGILSSLSDITRLLKRSRK